MFWLAGEDSKPAIDETTAVRPFTNVQALWIVYHGLRVCGAFAGSLSLATSIADAAKEPPSHEQWMAEVSAVDWDDVMTATIGINNSTTVACVSVIQTHSPGR